MSNNIYIFLFNNLIIRKCPIKNLINNNNNNNNNNMVPFNSVIYFCYYNNKKITQEGHLIFVFPNVYLLLHQASPSLAG